MTTAHDWLLAPVGIDAPRLVTRTGCRTVLVAAHTFVSCHRLLDVVDCIESDPRIQVVFTVAPDAFNRGVAKYLQDLGALTLPWRQAISEKFDLALTAAYGGLHELHGPLVMMAHGAGFGKPVPMRDYGGPPQNQRPVYGLDAQRLARDGRVLASAVLLSHERERHVLRRQCPEALDVAVVAGDPCFDRLVASLSWRQRYRQALGIRDRQRLVVVTSTWGRDGLFGSVPDLLPRLMDELTPQRYRVAALLHPAVWCAHGARQIRAWTRDCREAGMILLDPAEDWRSLVVAADHLIGDHGSVTAYGAAIGRPVLHLAPVERGVTTHGSAQEIVATRATRLDPGLPFGPQLRSAREVDHRGVTAALTSRPGQASRLIRSTIYELLRLTEPGRHRPVTPVRVPGTPSARTRP